MEARFLQTELQKALGKKIFLDSDDLRDLSKLQQHVRDSDCIVLVQSTNVLSRPVHSASPASTDAAQFRSLCVRTCLLPHV